MPKLIVVEGTDPTTFSLDADETVVGRHPDSAMHLRSNAVSGTHAKLINEDGSIFLEDLGSRNGTFVNNERIATRVELRDGDQIHFGPVLLRFEGQERPPVEAFGTSMSNAAMLRLCTSTSKCNAGHRMFRQETFQSAGNAIQIPRPYNNELRDYDSRSDSVPPNHLLPQTPNVLVKGDLLIQVQDQRQGVGV